MLPGLVDALKPGDHGDLAAVEGLGQGANVDRPDAGPGEGAVGQHLHLVSQQGQRLASFGLDGQRQQPHRDLLAGRGDHVELALVRFGADLAGQPEQAVGLARHGGDDDRHPVALSLRGEAAAGDVADAIDGADGGSAVFLNDEHGRRIYYLSAPIDVNSQLWRGASKLPRMTEPQPSADDVLLVLVTVPDLETGARIGRSLVEERLAACVNLIPGLRSIYRWQDKVQDESEALCLIKARRAGYDRLRDRIESLHPYEVPEIIAVAPTRGNAPYLRWIWDATADPG